MKNWIQIRRLSFFFLILLVGSPAFAQTFSILHDFGGAQDGENPQSGMVFDQAGNLYGTAALGGLNGNGIVYSLTPPEGGGVPWDESILYKFTGQPDGSEPVGPVVIISSGKLFGTTLLGGTHNLGTVFQLRPPAQAGDPWSERVLYSFGSSPTDGASPNAGLLPAGNGFYGVTRDGGANSRGTVFQVVPPVGGGGDWVETILYSFGPSGDANFPSGELIRDQAGNLYGNALIGGANNLGAVYQLSPPATDGGSWTETVIFSFSGSDGTLPFGPLEFDQNGLLYGTTDGGGSLSGGTVFQLTPSPFPGAPWTQTVLYNFSGGSPDGGTPVAGVKIDNRGRLYGTASTGGAGRPFPGGVVFRLNPPQNDGDPWTETVLHSFGGPDGFRSLAHLIRRGNAFYGTTSLGGLNGTGNAFLLMP